MRPRPQRRHPTTSRALDQSALQEEGFVGVLNGVGLLTDALRQGGQADGVAFKSITQGHQDGPVDLVQPKLVDPEQVQTLARRGSVDRTVPPNFGDVTDPSQKPVIPRISDKIYYHFDGEYWSDELPDMQFFIEDRCVD